MKTQGVSACALARDTPLSLQVVYCRLGGGVDFKSRHHRVNDQLEISKIPELMINKD